MKKIFIIYIAAIAVINIFLFKSTASSAEITVGGSAGYSWWEPVWKTGKMKMPGAIMSLPAFIRVNYDFGPQFQSTNTYFYGPFFSIKFINRIEISLNFNYKKNNLEASYLTQQDTVQYSKFDFISENYNINSYLGIYFIRYLKLFIGIKADITKTTGKFEFIGLSNPSYKKGDMNDEMIYHAPVIGLSFSIPIKNYYSITIDLPGFIAIGSDKFKFKEKFTTNINNISIMYTPDGKFLGFGFSPSISMKFLLPGINIGFILSFKYQVIQLIQKESEISFFRLNGELDHNYGINFSFTYTFSTRHSRIRQIWMPHPEYIYD